jgi:hypothetical protein
MATFRASIHTYICRIFNNCNHNIIVIFHTICQLNLINFYEICCDFNEFITSTLADARHRLRRDCRHPLRTRQRSPRCQVRIGTKVRGLQRQGPMLWILEIFLPQHLAFFAQNAASLRKTMVITLIFKKNAHCKSQTGAYLHFSHNLLQFWTCRVENINHPPSLRGLRNLLKELNSFF